MTTRRRFLQVGLAGAATLFVMGALQRGLAFAGRDPQAALAEGDARIVRALAPVVLAGALPSSAADREAALVRIVAGFGRVTATLAPGDREQLSWLMGLLRWRLPRFALTGLWHPVDEASERDIAAFLRCWRASSRDMLRIAYGGLTLLLEAAWYDDPESWPRIGYPGPPVLDAAAVR